MSFTAKTKKPVPSNLERSEFIAAFGGIYEASPWVAEMAFDAGIGKEADSSAGLFRAMSMALELASGDQKLGFIRAHPELAGKAAIQHELTDSSTAEQAGAGLDQCTPAEYAEFQSLNEAYNAKFGFPFIVAVRGRGRQEILEAFRARLGNSTENEYETALDQINQIARLRIQELLGD